MVGTFWSLSGNPGVAGGHPSAVRTLSPCQGWGRLRSHGLMAWHPDLELAYQALGEPQL